MNIDDIRDEWLADLEGKSDEFKAGAQSALKMIIEISKNFAGDACDFSEWLKDKL